MSWILCNFVLEVRYLLLSGLLSINSAFRNDLDLVKVAFSLFKSFDDDEENEPVDSVSEARIFVSEFELRLDLTSDE